MTNVKDAIGGYFSLEDTTGTGLNFLDDTIGYQSARSAMSALLQSASARAVWTPHFVCGALTNLFNFLGVRVHRYPLTPELGVPDNLPLGSSDWLICIDYCGLASHTCEEAIAIYGSNRVLVDASQALFHVPRPDVSIVYSPRKFAGVPDGGLLATPYNLQQPAMADEPASTRRCQYLLSRASGDIAKGYTQFQEAEASLTDCTPRAMSSLTEKMLRTIAFDHVKDRRIANYASLANWLGDLGFNVPTLPAGCVPLCCPVLGIEAARLRNELALRKIFAPAYWPDAQIPEGDPVGLTLKNKTLYLPCDQRYGEADMQRIVGAMAEIQESV